MKHHIFKQISTNKPTFFIFKHKSHGMTKKKNTNHMKNMTKEHRNDKKSNGLKTKTKIKTLHKICHLGLSLKKLMQSKRKQAQEQTGASPRTDLSFFLSPPR